MYCVGDIDARGLKFSKTEPTIKCILCCVPERSGFVSNSERYSAGEPISLLCFYVYLLFFFIFSARKTSVSLCCSGKAASKQRRLFRGYLSTVNTEPCGVNDTRFKWASPVSEFIDGQQFEYKRTQPAYKQFSIYFHALAVFYVHRCYTVKLYASKPVFIILE